MGARGVVGGAQAVGVAGRALGSTGGVAAAGCASPNFSALRLFASRSFSTAAAARGGRRVSGATRSGRAGQYLQDTGTGPGADGLSDDAQSTAATSDGAAAPSGFGAGMPNFSARFLFSSSSVSARPARKQRVSRYPKHQDSRLEFCLRHRSARHHQLRSRVTARGSELPIRG